MKKVSIIFLVILLIVLALIFKGKLNINIEPRNTDRTVSTASPAQTGNSNPETRESNDGPVSITVTPQNLGGSLPPEFDIVLNTHSEELSVDLVTNALLVDDLGKSYQPVSWEGDVPGGHHRQGILKFNTVSPNLKSIELKIRDVGGVAERSFKWTY